LQTLVVYLLAALAEIAGCFAFWAVVRGGHSIAWLAPGLVALALFAWFLTFAPAEQAGRAYAAYGGIYILASIFWLWAVERQAPDMWDAIGGAVARAGEI